MFGGDSRLDFYSTSLYEEEEGEGEREGEGEGEREREEEGEREREGEREGKRERETKGVSKHTSTCKHISRPILRALHTTPHLVPVPPTVEGQAMSAQDTMSTTHRTPTIL